MLRFNYKYRNRENAICCGEIAAADRDDVYHRLKADGVKPICVDLAPGLANRVKSLGKRWFAIVVLAALLLVAVAVAVSLRGVMREKELYEDRAQIYGDAAVLASMLDLKTVFADKGERWLAQYAIPARPVSASEVEDDVLLAALGHRIEFAEGEYAEVAKLKRIVNGMKRELREYLADGGNAKGYVRRLKIRQQTEIGLFLRAKAELEDEENFDVVAKRNAELRSMGLPMVLKKPENSPLTRE